MGSKSGLKNIGVDVVKKGCDHSCHRTLKLAVSPEGLNGINWFLVCWYKFRKAKSCFNKFLVVVVKNVCGFLGQGTLKFVVSHEWIDEINWFFQYWYKCRKAKTYFNIYWVDMMKNGRDLLDYGTQLWDIWCISQVFITWLSQFSKYLKLAWKYCFLSNTVLEKLLDMTSNLGAHPAWLLNPTISKIFLFLLNGYHTPQLQNTVIPAMTFLPHNFKNYQSSTCKYFGLVIPLTFISLFFCFLFVFVFVFVFLRQVETICQLWLLLLVILLC